MPDEIKISEDNGYFSGANLRYLKQKGLDSYIPDVNTTKKMKGKKLIDNPFSKDKFEFNEEEDCFICPNGEVLTRNKESMNTMLIYNTTIMGEIEGKQQVIY